MKLKSRLVPVAPLFGGRGWRWGFFLFLLFFFVIACSDDDEEPYPSLITELAMAQADAEGRMASFTTDGGQTYTVVNDITGMTADSRLRCLLGYTREEDGYARVYTAQAVPLLGDCTGVEDAPHHPTGIESAWSAGRFINLHLLPKTQGGKQAWGFLRDSVSTNVAGGQTYHLSLLHHQLDDPEAYSTHLYASLPFDSIATSFQPEDSLVLTVVTYRGPHTWRFGRLGL